jgi:hypothetical protein
MANLILFSGDSKFSYLDLSKIVAVELLEAESGAKTAVVCLAGSPSPLFLEGDGAEALFEKLVTDGVIAPSHPPS